MSTQGSNARTSRARAGVAIRIYKAKVPPRWGHTCWGRSLDGCFENGDGYAVSAWMCWAMVQGDTKLVDCVFIHHPKDEDWWLKKCARAVREGRREDALAVVAELCDKSRECDGIKDRAVDLPIGEPVGMLQPTTLFA